MWCGIVAIVFIYFFTILEPYRPEYAKFCVCVFLIALVTAGLIITFKDKKGKEGEARKPLNLRRGFRRITLLLSIVVALVAWLICFVFVFDSWDVERSRYSAYKVNYYDIGRFWHYWDANDFDARKREVIQYLLDSADSDSDARFLKVSDGQWYDAKAYELFPGIRKEMLDMPLHSLDEKANAAKEIALKRAEKKIKAHERWGNKSLPVTICFSMLAALPAGVLSLAVVWFIYFLLIWLTLGFRIDTG